MPDDSPVPAKRTQSSKTLKPSSKFPDIAGEVISVRVRTGQGEEDFHVHKAVICTSSKFFQNAIKPEWVSPRPRPIELEDSDPSHFKDYVQWLYCREVSTEPPNGAVWKNLAHLYVLGERIMDSVFQDAVIDAMIGHRMEIPRSPGNFAIKTIYEGTTASSPARRLMVEIWVWSAQSHWKGMRSLIKDTCAEFVADLIPALLEARPKPSLGISRPWETSLEAYHVQNGEKTQGSEID